jgi:hypothetical protein
MEIAYILFNNIFFFILLSLIILSDFLVINKDLSSLSINHITKRSNFYLNSCNLQENKTKLLSYSY